MATKTFKVALSLDNPRIIQSGIDVRSFDKQSIKISISLTKDSQTYQIPTGSQIKISLLKLARQEQKIIVDVPNTNRDSIDWIVPDYLDGYQGTVRVGVYLVSGTENVDLGYFTILSNVSDIDKMADEFTDNVFQGWEQIEADLNELNLTIAQANLDLADDLAQVDSTIANINAKNTQVNTLHSDVTSKYNAFDTSVTQANQTITDIIGLTDDVQQMGVEKANKTQEAWNTPTLLNGFTGRLRYRINQFNNLEIIGSLSYPTNIGLNTLVCFALPMSHVPNWFSPNADFTDLRLKFTLNTDFTENTMARGALSGFNGSFIVIHGGNRNRWHINMSIPMKM